MAVLTDINFRDLPDGAATLFAAAGEKSFFSRAEWYDVLARHGVPSGTSTRLYCDELAHGRVGLVCQVAPEGPRHLVSLATPYSVEHALLTIGGRADWQPALATIIAEIVAERPSWETITLRGFAADDPAFHAVVGELRRSRLAVEPFFDTGTWYEETGGASFADYLARRPSALRNTWQRKSAKAKRLNALGWRFVDGSDGIDQAIADYETVYRASWKKAEPFPRLIPTLIRTAAELGALRLGIVYLDDAPAAAQFWILWDGRACIYKLAHDERLKELSLGTLLTMRMIERVLERDKPSEINLGRGDDPYKKLWLSQRRETWGVMAADPRTWRGIHLALRQLAKRALQPWRGGRAAPPL